MFPDLEQPQNNLRIILYPAREVAIGTEGVF